MSDDWRGVTVEIDVFGIEAGDVTIHKAVAVLDGDIDRTWTVDSVSVDFGNGSIRVGWPMLDVVVSRIDKDDVVDAFEEAVAGYED